MNIELKKITWEGGNAASMPQLMTLHVRRTSDPDEEASYTTITENLQVHTDGTILNPPTINDLDASENYTFRFINNDPAGGEFDIDYTTPQTFKLVAPDAVYYPESELTYVGAGFRDEMLPPKSGFYYSLQYTTKDWFDSDEEIRPVGGATWQRKDDQGGHYVSYEYGVLEVMTDSAFEHAMKTQYALGVHFYVAAEDLPAAGEWPLLSYKVPGWEYGVYVYVNCATKKVHWRQASEAATQEIISAGTINTGAWNQLLVFRDSNIAASRMWLNASNAFTGAFTQNSVYQGRPDFLTVGAMKGIFSRVYFTSITVDNMIAEKYQHPPYPVGILEARYDPENRYTIPAKYLVAIDNKQVVFTLPADVPLDRRVFYLETSAGRSAPVDVNISAVQKMNSSVTVHFDPNSEEYSDDFTQIFNPMAKGWGGINGEESASGGVAPTHVYFQDNLLVLEAHGDQYNGRSQGFTEAGEPKRHDAPGDPSLGDPWTTRVGAALISRDYYGYGRYVMEVKLPRNMGVAPALWTSHYVKARIQDPRYDTMVAQGLTPGSNRDGDMWVVAYDQVSMEMPCSNAMYVYSTVEEMLSYAYYATWTGELVAVADDPSPENIGTWRLDNTAAPALLTSWTKISNEVQYIAEPGKDFIRCNAGIGETGPGNGINYEGYPSEDEYFAMQTSAGKDLWDGAFHEFRFDWYADRVEYYVDGQLIQVNRRFVPDAAGRWAVGLWFPSPANEKLPWRVDPFGVYGAWAGAAADWKYQKLFIRRLAHTPFTDAEAGGTNRLVGETYPFQGRGGYEQPLPG